MKCAEYIANGQQELFTDKKNRLECFELSVSAGAKGEELAQRTRGICHPFCFTQLWGQPREGVPVVLTRRKPPGRDGSKAGGPCLGALQPPHPSRPSEELGWEGENQECLSPATFCSDFCPL